MIPASSLFDQPTMAALLDHDPLVQDYRAFFSLLDWSVVEHWQAQSSVYCGTHVHPKGPYMKPFLICLREGMIYTTQLCSFLPHNPLLITEQGFHRHLD